MDLNWSEMMEHKVTMMTHNFHHFPPLDAHQKDPVTGQSLHEWEDDIRENVGWVNSACLNYYVLPHIFLKRGYYVNIFHYKNHLF